MDPKRMIFFLIITRKNSSQSFICFDESDRGSQLVFITRRLS